LGALNAVRHPLSTLTILAIDATGKSNIVKLVSRFLALRETTPKT
jgi:hypothetical protein